jgi:hypothetical protein
VGTTERLDVLAPWYSVPELSSNTALEMAFFFVLLLMKKLAVWAVLCESGPL